MRIVYFSDTHNTHEELEIPDGDLLIFGGDMSVNGTVEEIMDFLDWFQRLPHYYKILVPGNHDINLDHKMVGTRSERLLRRLSRYYDNLTNFYLENTPCEIEGTKIWGSPITPEYSHKWGFRKGRGSELRDHWNQIPQDTDILITHGPPKYHLDLWENDCIGDDDLLYHVQRVKPKLHLFGHVHENRGIDCNRDTVFINGAVVNFKDELNNPAWVIDYPSMTIYDNILNLTKT